VKANTSKDNGQVRKVISRPKSFGNRSADVMQGLKDKEEKRKKRGKTYLKVINLYFILNFLPPILFIPNPMPSIPIP
jgi:hypothetical protein